MYLDTFILVLVHFYIEVDDEEIWDESSSDELEDGPTSPSLPAFISSTRESLRAYSLMMWLLGFILVIQAKYYIPNAAIDVMLKFLYVFFTVLNRFSPFLNPILKVFPKSLYSLYKLVHYEDNFNKFVVCPKCETIYSHEDCVEKIGSQRHSKKCSNIKYPNHPFVTGRTPCHSVLLKTVQFISGNKLLYPFKLYCYKSVQSTLQSFFLRPDFHFNCQNWRTRPDSSFLYEIYDGKVWKDLQPFLCDEYALAFSLNVDWFQPFTHTVYSVGVIYLTILNLPRNLQDRDLARQTGRENWTCLGPRGLLGRQDRDLARQTGRERWTHAGPRAPSVASTGTWHGKLAWSARRVQVHLVCQSSGQGPGTANWQGALDAYRSTWSAGGQDRDLVC